MVSNELPSKSCQSSLLWAYQVSTPSVLFLAVMAGAVGRSKESSVNTDQKALTRTSMKGIAWLINLYCTYVLVLCKHLTISFLFGTCCRAHLFLASRL